MTFPRFTANLSAVLALALSACSNIATIREVTPRYAPSAAVAGTMSPIGSPSAAVLLPATSALNEAPALVKRTPLAAGEKYAAALNYAAAELKTHPENTEARNIYNFSLDRLFSLIRSNHYSVWTGPFQIGQYTLTLNGVPRAGWDPKLYEFLPADQLVVGGTYITDRVERDGLGSTLIAISREKKKEYLKDFGMARTYYGITAVAHWQGDRCEISFHDPLDESTVKMSGHTYPLAADFTAPLAVMLTRERPEKLGLVRLLDPDKYADTARLARFRPYNEERIPLVLVHGLLDTPATWVPLVNALRADAVIRERYQIWVYSYPSGYPYPYCAALLRRELDRAGVTFPHHKKMVVVGHSMGGILTRLLLTDSGEKIWDAYFGEPPPRVRMSAKEKQLMEDMLIFQSRDDVARAIFLNSPHHGAKMAGNWIGRIGRKLIRVPKFIISLGDAVRQVVMLSRGGLAYETMPTSVDSLTPNNLFVKTVNGLPLNPRIPFHSIIGDRGKPEARLHPELGSDGFVPYWSSHLEGAQSELIIPSNHTGHQSPQGIAEVIRILRLHLKTAAAR